MIKGSKNATVTDFLVIRPKLLLINISTHPTHFKITRITYSVARRFFKGSDLIPRGGGVEDMTVIFLKL